MKNGTMFLAVLVTVAIVVGCSTTSGPLFRHSETLEFSGQRALGKINPTAKVDPSQTAALGINGPSGPYAAVLAAAGIYDQRAMTEAIKAIREISYNESQYYGFGRGRGRGGRGLYGAYDRPQRGALVNNADSTRFVQFLDEDTITPVMDPIEVPAKDYLFINLLPNDDPGYRMLVTDVNDTEIYQAHVEIDEEINDAWFFVPGSAQSVETNWAIPITK